jgi:hypothetical protein
MQVYAAQAAAVPPHFFTVTITAACTASVLALLLKWKPLRRAEALIPWLLLVAGIGFAAAFLNGWVHALAGAVNGIPIFGAAVMFIAAVVLTYIIGYDFWPRHPSNRTTEISAVLMPSFVPYLGGAVGAGAAQALSWIAITSAALLSKAFGV